jgi:L-ascorbate metabolism protein UlaG (beta-lactamase superfamily)
VGTATVLIRFAGMTVLTDPNFIHRHQRIDLGYGLHAVRLTDPALEIHELPPLDLVVVSHLHEDHFDRVAAAGLDHTLPIFTTPDAREHLARLGFEDCDGLRTWESREVLGDGVLVRVTSLPARHGPPLASALLPTLLPPVMGSLLDFETESGRRLLRVYLSGDTLVHGALAEIPRRFPDIDVAVLHLGGARVMGVMVTMDGDQGARLARLVDPRLVVPVHYDDYDRCRSPIEEFQRAARAAGIDARVRLLRRGDRLAFSVPQPIAH